MFLDHKGAIPLRKPGGGHQCQLISADPVSWLACVFRLFLFSVFIILCLLLCSGFVVSFLFLQVSPTV